ncbi:hypothetical protein VT84_37560 [Gemmata sp. SH-PL17]|uniref:hypothetical protein n=1 Tax=Gemmata sp. SH-PL17 TaxID=1630693 RepID=UPI00078C63A1|nr:hypothetical protein [Gemmata sp. SH-PL17]AMV30161.1 hypothetical protein VT84_37560 [Gemmata sp. SH-PL17]
MSRNRSLAITLAFGVTALCAAAAVAIFSWPEEAMKRFDTVWFRIVLLLVCTLLAALIGVELYSLWHDPPAKRMIRHLVVYVMGVGGLSSVSPFGLLGLQKFQGFGIEVTAQDATSATALSIGMTFLALIILGVVYVLCCVFIPDTESPSK